MILTYLLVAHTFGLLAAVFSRSLPWLAKSCAVLLAGMPFLASAPLPARLYCAFGALLIGARLSEILDCPNLSFGQRIWHVHSIYDTRQIRRSDPQLSSHLFLGAVFYGGLAIAGIWLGLRWAPSLSDGWRTLGRWGGGLVFLYGTIDAADHFLQGIHRALGLIVPPAQNRPILSLTLSEFWSERWNRAVSSWLRDHVFRPTVRVRFRLTPRQRLQLGLAATFIVSGLLHGYLAAVGLEPQLVVLAILFFPVQGLLIAVEQRLRISRCRPAIARTWTLGLMLLTAPLLLEPVMQLLSR